MPRASVWTPAEDDELRSGLAAGRTPREMAVLLGYNINSLKTRIRRLGIRSLGGYRVKDDTRQAMDDLAEQMAEGCPSLTEASRRVGLTQQRGSQVWALVQKRLGIEQCR